MIWNSMVLTQTGHLRFEDSNNNVFVPPFTLPVEHQSVQEKVLEQIDPLTSSTQMGIDIYHEIHQIVNKSIENI